MSLAEILPGGIFLCSIGTYVENLVFNDDCELFRFLTAMCVKVVHHISVSITHLE